VSALPTRAEFLATYGRMETLKRQAAEARIEAAKREPLWVSVTLTFVSCSQGRGSDDPRRYPSAPAQQPQG
jgi:hypothetical protein